MTDQNRICERYANSNGLEITKKYSDKAISGKIIDRPMYQELLTDIQNGEIQTLIVDDLSRLSRSMGAASVIEEFNFLGVRLISVGDGIDTNNKSAKLLIGIRTAMNSTFLDDLKQKVHRGIEGNAIKGYTTGGRTYGYRPVPHYSDTEKDVYGNPEIEYATLAIRPEEAVWVKWIFEKASELKSYSWIAKELNRKKVPCISGNGWTTSTLSSSSNDRLSGILNNKTYIGIKIWNKTETIYNPKTGKPTKKNRDESEWVVKEIRELRIISDELWLQVKERQKKQKNATNKKQKNGHKKDRTGRTPKYLFSSMLKCSECGANLIMVDKKNYRCGDAHRRGEEFCTNKRKVDREVLEGILLQSIKEDLFTDLAVKAFKDEAEKLFEQHKKEFKPKIRQLTSELNSISKKESNLMQVIENNSLASNLDTIINQLSKLSQQRNDIEIEIESEKNLVNNIEPILPNAIKQYKELVDNLTDSLKNDMELLRDKVSHLIGSEIKMTPINDKEMEASYRGNYRGLLRLAGGTNNFKISDDALRAPYIHQRTNDFPLPCAMSAGISPIRIAIINTSIVISPTICFAVC
ncbi:MAG: recombinase family protein [Woeseiaceae bacterium]